MSFSVIVPVYNEAENIQPLLQELADSLSDGPMFEVIYVNDDSDDDSAQKLTEAAGIYPWLRIIEHQQRSGQSAALVTGIKAAQYPVIVTLDGDGQNDPDDIPVLMQMYVDDASTAPLLLAGHRVTRRDSISKRLSSRIANAVRSAFLGDGVPDTGCGLKVFPRELFLQLPCFDHMHRFLPALVKSHGAVVKSVAVGHRSRQRGVTKYGVGNRLWVGIEDMLGVKWLMQHPPLNEDNNAGWLHKRGLFWLKKRHCEVASSEVK
ncbi:MAG: glycosyltransferase family 2 protein [Gammaproteobacteria bacterium]